MATVTRRCVQCKRQFRVPNEIRRTYCESCRPPKRLPGTIVSISGNTDESQPAVLLGNVNKPGDGVIETVVRGELQAIDREGSVPGALALRLAQVEAGTWPPPVERVTWGDLRPGDVIADPDRDRPVLEIGAEPHDGGDRVKVIYDAAHAFGVRCADGRSVLRHGDLSVLSFHATKVFNTFEGGAIVCPVSQRIKREIRIICRANFSLQVR